MTAGPSTPRPLVASSRYALYRGRYREHVRLAGLALVTALVATARPYPGIRGRGLVILVLLVGAVVGQAAAVVAPERFPVARPGFVVLASAVLAAVDPGTAGVFLVFAGLDAAASLSPSTGGFLVAAGVVVELLATLVAGDPLVDGFYGLAGVGGFLLGSTMRQYVLRVEEAELRVANVERADQERATAVRLAERAAAAREIHDVLAHTLGALVIQLDTVNALLESERPDLAGIRPVLRDAHRHAVDGLVEARRAVSSLREDSRPLEPWLRELVDSVPGACLAVDGRRRAVPPDVSLAVRRIAQEALTNARKHAPGSTATLRLAYEASNLRLTVSDEGPRGGARPSPLGPTGGGYGLEGMRERAERIGAVLAAGPDGPGWTVELVVPDRPVA